MKTSVLITTIAIILIFGVTLFTVLKTETDKKTPGAETNIPSNTNENTALPENNETITPQQDQVQTNYIEIIAFGYSPNELTIRKGDTVTWTNTDTRTSHTVTSTSGGELKSKFLKNGENYTHTFEKEGKFFYYCIPHTSVHGQITVE